MNVVEANLETWQNSLFNNISVAGLLARSEIAHKWKSPYRAMVIREAALWRACDLLVQSNELYKSGHLLGARILLRSAVETTAILIYLNQLIQKVLKGALNFHEFGSKASRLLLGSRDELGPVAINILTVLEKSDEKYPGIKRLYDRLSESAHPNYEGLCRGYSKVDQELYETEFSNRWVEQHGEQHLKNMEICIFTFHHEYNDVWPPLFKKLERWIEENDAELEATKVDH